MTMSSMADVLRRTWAGMERARHAGYGGVTGIASGFPSLDRETSGWQPGDLIVVAARPNVGKTTLALHLGLQAAQQQASVLFVPLEMSAEACAMRVIAAHGHLDEKALRTGQAVAAHYTDAARGIEELSALPFSWLEAARLVIPALRDAVSAQPGCGLVIVDQLGNLKPSNTRDSRVWQIAELTGELKALAVERGLALIVCHQLNRESEQTQERRPELHHLRDSGAVEQDADVVLLMHREWVPGSQHTGPIEVTLAKNRRGPRATVKLTYHARETRFEEFSAPGREEAWKQ